MKIDYLEMVVSRSTTFAALDAGLIHRWNVNDAITSYFIQTFKFFQDLIALIGIYVFCLHLDKFTVCV